jgi:NADPH-dependent ferric siderophore reductase
MSERFPRRVGIATLLARTTLTPRMIRVTLGAEAFGDAWPIEQPGEIITLLFLAPKERIVLCCTARLGLPRRDARAAVAQLHRSPPRLGPADDPLAARR